MTRTRTIKRIKIQKRNKNGKRKSSLLFQISVLSILVIVFGTVFHYSLDWKNLQHYSNGSSNSMETHKSQTLTTLPTTTTTTITATTNTSTTATTTALESTFKNMTKRPFVYQQELNSHDGSMNDPNLVYTTNFDEFHRKYMNLDYLLFHDKNDNDDTNRRNPKSSLSLSSCQRQCKQPLDNHLILAMGDWFPMAGLADRIYILQRMINLAGYLCATLHIPKPNVLLAKHHNQGRSLPQQSTWKDYIVLTPLRTNTNENTDNNNNDNPPEPEQQLPAFEELDNFATFTPTYWEDGQWKKRSIDPNNLPIVFKSESKEDTIQHFLQAEAFTVYHQSIDSHYNNNNNNNNKNASNYFVWKIKTWFWQWSLLFHMPPPPPLPGMDPFLRPSSPSLSLQPTMKNENPIISSIRQSSFPDGIPYWRRGCRYYSQEIPWHIQKIVQRVWKAVLVQHQQQPEETATATNTTTTSTTIPTSTIGAFHIRRGDMQHECDTSLEQIQKYIDCSLHGSEELGNLTILLLTDETDPQYVQAVHDMLMYYTNDNNNDQQNRHPQSNDSSPLHNYHHDNSTNKQQSSSSFVHHRRGRRRSHIQVFHLDTIVRVQAQAFVAQHRRTMDRNRFENEFIIYEIALVFCHDYAAFTMSQRRFFDCPECDRLVDKVNVDWVGKKN